MRAIHNRANKRMKMMNSRRVASIAAIVTMACTFAQGQYSQILKADFETGNLGENAFTIGPNPHELLPLFSIDTIAALPTTKDGSEVFQGLNALSPQGSSGR